VARARICWEDGGVISIDEVLETLRDTFGDRFPISDDTYKVIRIVNELWDDPHIDQIDNGGIEFCWNKRGSFSEPDNATQPTFKSVQQSSLSGSANSIGSYSSSSSSTPGSTASS
jgi:hypothetical protein